MSTEFMQFAEIPPRPVSVSIASPLAFPDDGGSHYTLGASKRFRARHGRPPFRAPRPSRPAPQADARAVRRASNRGRQAADGVRLRRADDLGGLPARRG